MLARNEGHERRGINEYQYIFQLQLKNHGISFLEGTLKIANCVSSLLSIWKERTQVIIAEVLNFGKSRGQSWGVRMRLLSESRRSCWVWLFCRENCSLRRGPCHLPSLPPFLLLFKSLVQSKLLLSQIRKRNSMERFRGL